METLFGIILLLSLIYMYYLSVKNEVKQKTGIVAGYILIGNFT